MILPRMRGSDVNQDKINFHKKNLKKAVGHIDTYFLRDKPFMCGEEISIADVLVASELLHMYGCREEQVFTHNATVMAWLGRVKKEIGPQIYSEAFQKIEEFAEFADQPKSNL